MLAQSLQELRQQVALRERYDNFIGGKWVPPVKGPIFRQCEPDHRQAVQPGGALDSAEDIELALDAAHAAREAWGNTAPAAARQAAEQDRRPASKANLRLLALAETIDNGKPIRETTAADVPLVHRPFPLFRRLHPRAGRRHLARSTTTRSPIISMSRSASSARSFRGISRC